MRKLFFWKYLVGGNFIISLLYCFGILHPTKILNVNKK